MTQVIRPEQVLTERWEATYTRFPWSSRERLHTTARLNVPHHVIVGSCGKGATVEEARIDCLVMLTAGYVSAEDIHDGSEMEIRDETLDFLAKTVRAEQRRRRVVKKAAAA